jgi:AAA15 family ATPase/GTPase
MNPVIHNLQINSFRGLKGLNLPDLGWVNILVGKNNSGKTTILEAISIACNPLDPFQWVGTSERRLNIARSPIALRPSLESIEWLFPQENHELDRNLETFNSEIDYQEIDINIEGKNRISVLAVTSEIYGIGVPSVTDDRLDDDTLSDRELETSSIEFERTGLELEVVASNAQQTPNETVTFEFWEDEKFLQRRRSRVKPFINQVTIYPLYSTSDVLLALRLSEITKEGAKEELLNAIRLFDSEILDIQILSTSRNRSSLYVQHKRLGFAPFYTFGDGLKKTLLIALALPIAKDGILLIDEIETSIHFSALSQVFDWLIRACRVNNTQLFVTTHSLEAVDAMLDVESKKEEVVAFRLNSAGEPPQRFAGELLQRLRSNRGLDVR